MSKYKLVDDNVVISTEEELTSYFYSIPLINTELTSHKTSEIVSKYITKMLKDVNQFTDIYLVPTELDTDKIINHYDNDYSSYGDETLEEIYDSVRKDTFEQINQEYRYNYKLIIVFSETKRHYFKSRFKGIKSKKNNEITPRIIKLSKEINNAILEKMQVTYKKVSKLTTSETTQFLKYLEVPDYNSTNYAYQTFDDHIEYKYETKDKIQNKYSTISAVKEFPHEIKGFFSFVSDIQKFRFPVDVIIKLHTELNAPKIARNIETQQNLATSYDNKYKRETGKSLKDSKIIEYLGKVGGEEFQNLNNYMFKFQVFFRVTASSKELMDERYITLKKVLSKDKDYLAETVMLLGSQKKVANHVLPGRFNFNDYVHHTSKEFLTSLKLVSGISIGDSEGIVTAYTVNGKKPVMIDFIAPMSGKTASTSTSIYVSGVTGSGKTQMVNQIMLNTNIVSGIKSLTLDPKGDRSKIANKFSFVNEIKITDSKYKGVLDPFLYESKQDELLNKVGSLVKSLLYINDDKIIYDNYSVVYAFNEYIECTQEKSFKGFLKVLSKYNEQIAKQVGSFEFNKYSAMYFSDGKDTVNHLNYDSLNTIINLDAPSKSSQGEDEKKKKMTDQLLELVVSECEVIIMDFLKKVSGPKMVIIDEASMFKSLSSPNFINNLVKIIRSMGGILFVLTQNFTDFNNDELANFGMFFVGSVGSSSHLGKIANKFRVSEESISFLEVDNNDPSVDEEYKHKFLLVDANQQKAIVKAWFLPTYKKQFDTTTVRGSSYEISV